MDEDTLKYLFSKMKLAVGRAMCYVQSEQVWNPSHGGAPMQRDQPAEGYYGASLLTRVDAESTRILIDALYDISGAKILSKNDTQGQGLYTLLVDSCDGSLPMLQGLLTSTVILGLLDPDGVNIATVIGDPISCRMWSATSRANTTVQVLSPKHPYGEKFWLGTEHPTRVWQGDLSRETTVYMDRTHGHKRAPRQILTDEDARDTVGLVMRRSGVMIVGSNGMHHSLVANGGERVAGSITTAMGGAWDACGALLVQQAGGSVCGYKLLDHVPDDPSDEALIMSDGRYLQDIAGLCPLEWDVVVAANNGRNLIALTRCVSAASPLNL